MMIADSDVLIDFLKGKGEGAKRVALELETGACATTAISAFELRSGGRTAPQRKEIEALLEALTILPFGPEEARLAGELRLELEARGQPIGMADYLVAAVCLATGGILITRNRRHFERVEGLRLSSP